MSNRLTLYPLVAGRAWAVAIRLLRGSLLRIVLALALASPVGAEVRESGSVILDRRAELLLERLPTYEIGLPERLASDRDLYLIITAGAAFTEVTAFAPASVPPERIARALEAGAGSQAVEWSRDGEYAAARFQQAQGRFGAISGQRTVPVGRIVAGLRQAGFNPHALFRVGRQAKLSTRPAQERVTANFRNYNVSTAAEDLRVTVSTRLSTWDVAASLFFVGFVALVGVGGLAAAILFGRSPAIPIERRRKLYPRLATWPIFIGMGIHAPLALLYLRSGSPRALVDLWFGSARTMVLAPAIMLPIIPMLLLLPLNAMVERKLFGPSEPPAEGATPTPFLAVSHSQLMWRLLPLGLGLALVFGRPALASEKSPLWFWLFIAGQLLIFAGPRLVARFQKSGEGEATPAEPELAERARKLAERMGTSLREVVVDCTPAGKAYVGASVRLSGRITVSRKLVEALTVEEQRFILAHELAHVRLGHLPRMFVLSLLGVVMMFAPPVLVLSARLSVDTGFIIASVLGGMALTFGGVRWLSRRHELDADCLALSTTGDLAAAERALQALVRYSPLPYAHEVEDLSTHPSMSRRLAALRARAADMSTAAGGGAS